MMDPSSFGSVSLQTVAAGGSGELASVRPAFAPAVAATSNRALTVAIFCTSLVLHAALLVRLETGRADQVHSRRKASQVEIQITRPPPPPTPVVIPPQALQPPPPKPLPAARPVPHLSLPDPVHGAAAAGPEAPALDAPPTDEGTSATGTGEVAAPAVAAPPPPPPPPPPLIEAKEGAKKQKNPRPA
jgi:hypothetical protein